MKPERYNYVSAMIVDDKPAFDFSVLETSPSGGTHRRNIIRHTRAKAIHYVWSKYPPRSDGKKPSLFDEVKQKFQLEQSLDNDPLPPNMYEVGAYVMHLDPLASASNPKCRYRIVVMRAEDVLDAGWIYNGKRRVLKTVCSFVVLKVPRMLIPAAMPLVAPLRPVKITPPIAAVSPAVPPQEQPEKPLPQVMSAELDKADEVIRGCFHADTESNIFTAQMLTEKGLEDIAKTTTEPLHTPAHIEAPTPTFTSDELEKLFADINYNSLEQSHSGTSSIELTPKLFDIVDGIARHHNIFDDLSETSTDVPLKRRRRRQHVVKEPDVFNFPSANSANHFSVGRGKSFAAVPITTNNKRKFGNVISEMAGSHMFKLRRTATDDTLF